LFPEPATVASDCVYRDAQDPPCSLQRHTPLTSPILTLGDRPLADIDPRLFGQFFERAAWDGELGPEAAMHPTRPELSPDVLRLLHTDTPPILRFPGGNDVDRTDWRDLIDGAHGKPGRPATQTVKDNTATTRFGYDEFFRLTESLDTSNVLVLNFCDALLKKRPVADAATHAAGLVAYATSPVGGTPPEGMPDWPGLRERNGRAGPYRVGWVQIGNETWWPHKVKAVQEAIGSDEPADYLAWYRQCLAAMIRAVRAVNPHIPIIVDGWCGLGIEQQVLRDDIVREHVSAAAIHAYSPWWFYQVNREGQRIPVESLDHEAWWRLFASCPGAMDDAGRNIAWRDDELALYQELNLPIAVTEWNWFALDGEGTRPEMDLAPAMLVGAANFIHGLIRRADRAVMGCQSMLMGISWDITGIRVDPTGKAKPWYYPQYRATSTYARYCGQALLDCRVQGAGGYEQPYATGNMMARAHEHVAWLDVVATATGARSALFILNRHRHEAVTTRIDASARHPAVAGDSSDAAGYVVRRHVLASSPPGERSHPFHAARLSEGGPRRAGSVFDITLPPASVTIVEIAPEADVVT